MTFDEVMIRIPGAVQSEWTQHVNGLGWIGNNAHADASAKVEGLVYGNAWVGGNAQVSDNA